MKKQTIVISLIILGLGLFVRLIRLDQSFWLDEAAQVIESSRPLDQQVNLAADFHPPLFHILLHFWMKFGTTEIWVRMLSVFSGMVTIVLSFEVARKWFGLKVAYLVSVFIALSGYLIWYSQEARPYMLFVTSGIWVIWEYQNRRFARLTLAATVCLYSLYFAPIYLFSILIAALVCERKFFLKTLFSLIGSGIVFLFWIPSLLKQLEVGFGGVFSGWTSVVSMTSVKAVPLTFAKFIFGHGSIENNFIYLFVISIPAFIFLYGCYHCVKNSTHRMPVIILSVMLLIAAILGLFLPVLAPSRMIVMAPFFYMLLGYGITMFSKPIQKIGTILIVVISLLGITQYWFDPKTSREQWREAVYYLESQPEARQSAALFIFPDPFAPYLWYSKGVVQGIGIAKQFILSNDDLSYLEPKLKSFKHVYLFSYLSTLTDPPNKISQGLIQTNFQLVDGSTQDFPGVGFVYRYDRK